jgi:hypothetical protein
MGELARRVQATWRDIDVAPPIASRAKAFVPIWRRPWMALGTPTYGADLLAQVGVTTIYDAEPYPSVALEDVRARRPDVVLAPSEPYPFRERHRLELESLAPTYFVDGKDLFWWGERTRTAMGRLSAQLSVVV